jgi:hypothetical protein
MSPLKGPERTTLFHYLRSCFLNHSESRFHLSRCRIPRRVPRDPGIETTFVRCASTGELIRETISLTCSKLHDDELYIIGKVDGKAPQGSFMRLSRFWSLLQRHLTNACTSPQPRTPRLRAQKCAGTTILLNICSKCSPQLIYLSTQAL